MIVDTMDKYEVMRAIRKDFDNDVLPYYTKKIKPLIAKRIQEEAKRKKQPISLKWIEYTSTNNIQYHILPKGDERGDSPIFISECRWRRKTYFASLHPNQIVAVYSQHSLERYEERVLNQEKPLRDVLNIILKKQSHAFHIVLPSPTHQYTLYHSVANALFLGDYEIPQSGDDPSWNWYNTCISLNEAGASQNIIYSDLAKLQAFTNYYKCNPLSNHEHFENFVQTKIKTQSDKDRIIEFLQIGYSLYELHRSCQFSFSELFVDKINSELAIIEKMLYELGITDLTFVDLNKYKEIFPKDKTK